MPTQLLKGPSKAIVEAYGHPMGTSAIFDHEERRRRGLRKSRVQDGHDKEEPEGKVGELTEGDQGLSRSKDEKPDENRVKTERERCE